MALAGACIGVSDQLCEWNWVGRQLRLDRGAFGVWLATWIANWGGGGALRLRTWVAARYIAGSPARQRGDFLLAPQKKVTRPPGRDPAMPRAGKHSAKATTQRNHNST